MVTAEDTKDDLDEDRWWSFSEQQGSELTYGYGSEEEAKMFAKYREKVLEQRNPDAYVFFEEADDATVERLNANAPAEGCNLKDELGAIYESALLRRWKAGTPTKDLSFSDILDEIDEAEEPFLP